MHLGKIREDKIKERVNKMKEEPLSIFGGLLIIIAIPIILFLIVFVGIPLLLFLIVIWKIDAIKSNIELKKLIKINNGKLYFIYAEYNDYDFVTYFESNHKDVKCVKVNSQRIQSSLIQYLVKGSLNKSYPRLAKIQDNNVVSKEHYNSFKNLYKRRNDIENFFDLIEKSIKNLSLEK